MTKEEAINSFKKSNEQTKLNIQVHRHIMDTSEIRELEWYIERDKMAIEALEQKQKTGHWIYDTSIENWKCDKCGKMPKTVGYVGTEDFMREHFRFCNHCGAKMSEIPTGSESEGVLI